MSKGFHILTACVLFLLSSRAVGDETASEGCVGEGCAARGRSILQRERKDIAVEMVGEDESELSFRQEDGMMIEQHGKYEIRSLSTLSTSSSTEQTWIMSLPHGCHHDELVSWESGMLEDMKETFKSDSDAGGICVLMMNGTRSALKRALDKSSLPADAAIEADGVVSTYNEPLEAVDMSNLVEASDPNLPWGLDRVDDRSGLDGSYSPPQGFTGKDVDVFVFDTGIRTTHSDFEGRAVATLDVTAGSPKECKGDVTCAADRHGHGTHCAGTVGGKTYGVAKKATLHAMKVLSDSGSGSYSGIIEAFDWVKKQAGARPGVVSASLGGPGKQSSIKNAVDAVVGAGVPVVVAAGNSWNDACQNTPAYVPQAITVGATSSDDWKAGFSCFGTCLDIFAPGVDVKSAWCKTDTQTNTISGTSMACPHVSGAVALLFEEDPTRTASDVEHFLKARGTPGVVKDPKAGSPNLFLYTGLDLAPPTPAPTPYPLTPKPTPYPTPKPTPYPPTPPPNPVAVGNCGFESKTTPYCGIWRDSLADTFDWTWQKGVTGSAGTGPSKAYEGSYYLYIETSSPRQYPDKAILESAPLAYSQDLMMTFMYHMKGADMGKLVVTVDDAHVFKAEGEQGPNWMQGSVDISWSKGKNPTIRFEAWYGNGFQGDIAIDQINFVSPHQTTAAPTPMPSPVPPVFQTTTPPTVIVGPPGPRGPTGPPGPTGWAGPPGPPGPPR